MMNIYRTAALSLQPITDLSDSSLRIVDSFVTWSGMAQENIMEEDTIEEDSGCEVIYARVRARNDSDAQIG